jgi:hypothetical protein
MPPLASHSLLELVVHDDGISKQVVMGVQQRYLGLGYIGNVVWFFS